MSKNFKQSMAWIHTWLGLIVGWLMFAVFVTGTSAYYKEETSSFMKPKLAQSKPNENTHLVSFDAASSLAKEQSSFFVTLPNDRIDTIRVLWKGLNEQGKRATIVKQYDAATGEEIITKQTAGGDFLFRFHYKLHGIPKVIGEWLVAFVALAMFIAIVTGILIHSKILKDLFVFRPEKRLRNWMDGHILLAVAALPFLIMISYSSLLLSSKFMMPWASSSVYDNRNEYRQDLNALKSGKETVKEKKESKKNKNPQQKTAQRKPKQASKEIVVDTNENIKIMQNILNSKVLASLNSRNVHALENTNARRIIQEQKNKHNINKYLVTKEKLITIYKKAQKIWGNNIGGFAISQNKKKNIYTITFYEKSSKDIFNSKVGRSSLIFDLKSAKLLQNKDAISLHSSILVTNATLDTLHRAWFANTPMRILFFILGLSSCIVIATGLILWNKKRQHKSENNLSYKLVEKLNLGTIFGLSLAICAYFIANKLIPEDIVNRANLEINAFFIVWLLSYIHAFLLSSKITWRQQILLTAILCFAIVLIDFALYFNNLNLFDLFFAVCGMIFLLMFRYLQKRQK